MNKQTCTCVELLGNKKDWHLASHAINCPLYKGFDKEEFERQAEEVQKTFQEPEQDWEKEWDRLTSDHEFDYVNDGKAFIQDQIEEVRKQEREKMANEIMDYHKRLHSILREGCGGWDQCVLLQYATTFKDLILQDNKPED